jgi:phage terminase large subunit-like protein
MLDFARVMDPRRTGVDEKERRGSSASPPRRFKPSLLRAGFTETIIAERFQELAQTTKMVSPAMANLERLLLDGPPVHDSPVLSMCVLNTVVRMDAAGNRAPDKRKSTYRIDGTVALIMALATAPSAHR